MSLRPRGTVGTAPRGRLLSHPRRTGSRPRPSDGRRSPAPSRTAGRFRPNGRRPALSPACNSRRMGLLPCFLLFPSDGCGLTPELPRQAWPRLALPSPHRARAEPAPGGAEVCFSLSWDILRWLRSQGRILVSVVALAVPAAGALHFTTSSSYHRLPKGRKFRTPVRHTSDLYGIRGTQGDGGGAVCVSSRDP